MEYYKLMENGDAAETTGYDGYSMKLLKEVNGKVIIIDISISYNIHRIYELNIIVSTDKIYARIEDIRRTDPREIVKKLL